MQFSRVGDCFKIARITGPRHNYLGLEFTEAAAGLQPLIDALPAIGKRPGVLLVEAVRKNVLEGVGEANKQFGTKYVVKRIEFVVDDSSPAETYRFLAYSIVERIVKELPFT